MDPLAGAALRAHFAALPDPRVARSRRHDRLDIVTIAVWAVLYGADTWVDIETWGTAKLPWRRTWLDLPHGIPSHDTFGRVFAALDPQAFAACFLGWVRAVAAGAAEPVVAIDGKPVRRSHDRAAGRGPLPLVSAWAGADGLVLGQVAVDDHSNESAAIPALRDVLELEGALVSIDAMGGPRPIARRIRQRGADYVLALKDTQPTLHELVAHHVAVVTDGDAAGLQPASHTTVGKDHGRPGAPWAVRRCWATDDPEVRDWLDPKREWPDLGSVACVEGERRIGQTVTRERRSYLTSRPADPVRIGAAVRGPGAPWARIDNRLHWVLDIACREDACRVRTGHAAENFAVRRPIARNLLRQDRTATIGTKAKRLKCGWDAEYLLTVLAA